MPVASIGPISNSSSPDVATVAALVSATSDRAALADAETSIFTPTDSCCGLHLQMPEIAEKMMLSVLFVCLSQILQPTMDPFGHKDRNCPPTNRRLARLPPARPRVWALGPLGPLEPSSS